MMISNQEENTDLKNGKMQKPKAIFCWSGGKDSAFALFKILQEGLFDVVSLLTTLNKTHKRVSMHGVRETLLDSQSASLEMPLAKVWVKGNSNEEYESLMEAQLLKFKKKGVTHVIFGDIFLEDLRAYREAKLSTIGLTGVFPLWKMDTKTLINEFQNAGFETVTCCISSKTLPECFIGKKVDQEFLDGLPEHIDPCGENGEFHTFCYKGPIFKNVIPFVTGDIIFKPVEEMGGHGEDGFWFIDLLPFVLGIEKNW
jgi:uncharacterized protein (TIGR00290 family)